jgi:hypothetical protein
MKQPELARSGRGASVPAPTPTQPVVQPPKDVVLAAFTPRELETLRSVCRDSENEMGLRALNAGLARGGK